MNRVRPVEALLAALATLAVTLPLTTLFTPLTWFRPSVLLVAVVALVGMGLRRITANRPLVVVGQLVLLVNAAALMHGSGHLLGGLLPTPETGRAFGVLLQEAQATVTNCTAPAPSNRGTILAISLLIGLTALAVDAIGVTYRSPALAGIPLLSARPCPSAISSRSQAGRSCSSSGTSPRRRPRVARRAWVSSISASSPATSGSSGSRVRRTRVSRIASAHRSSRTGSSPDVAR